MMDWGTPCGSREWSPDIWMSEGDPLCMMAPLTCPALPGDPVLGLCKVQDRPLQLDIYAFKMLLASYETIKYFLQQQQVITESNLNDGAAIAIERYVLYRSV